MPKQRRSKKLVPTRSKNTTAPSLPLEIWNIILQYAVVDLTKELRCFLKFTRGKSLKFCTDNTRMTEYIRGLAELCGVNRAFRASVTRQEAYTRIWNRMQLLYPIHRVSHVACDCCNCVRNSDCKFKGKWVVVLAF